MIDYLVPNFSRSAHISVPCVSWSRSCLPDVHLGRGQVHSSGLLSFNYLGFIRVNRAVGILSTRAEKSPCSANYFPINLL